MFPSRRLWSKVVIFHCGPDKCPRCNGAHLWGHGYVGAIFDGISEQAFLRRFRCPACGCVLRIRPDGHFSRFQASVSTIRSRIVYRPQTGRWMGGMSRSRQGYRLSNLRRRVTAHRGLGWKGRLISDKKQLHSSGMNTSAIVSSYP